MTQSREALAIMDGTAVTFSKRRGLVLSRWGIVLTAAVFLAAVVATGLLVYKFAPCGQLQPAGTYHTDDGLDNGTSRTAVPAYPADSTVHLAPSSTKYPKIDVRLPRAVTPESYTIRIIPFIYEGNFTFNGEVSVVIKVKETTSNVTLHFNDLKIHEDTVTVTEHVPTADGSSTGKI
jgi:aminopeptidase N